MKFNTIKQIFLNSCKSIKNNNVIVNLSIMLISAVISFGICLLLKGTRWEYLINLVSAFLTLILFVIIIFILEYWTQKKKQKQEDYFKTINSNGFKDFTNDVMEEYYGKEYLTTLEYEGEDKKPNYCKIPVYCLQSSGDTQQFSKIVELDRIISTLDLKLSDNGKFDIKDHQNYKKNKYYRKYKDFVEDKIKYPDRPGYMLDKIITKKGDKELLIDKVNVHVGTFAENTYSSHVLEYELYKAYIDYKKEWKNRKKNKTLDESFWKRVKNSLKIRNEISDVCGGRTESLLCGEGRHALLSVQMLVLIQSKSEEPEVKMIQRSKNVSIAPGEYQFVPCGYFEVFNDSDDGRYDKNELNKNSSPGCAVFREYLEELFQEKDFEGGGIGTVSDRILKDQRIKKISKLLEKNKASLILLGSAMDLRILCHFLSFALIIKDDSYNENQFIGNDEVRKGKIFSQSTNQLNYYWDNMNFCSTALWYLFTKYDGMKGRSKQ